MSDRSGRPTRRSFLAALGLGTTSVAGCLDRLPTADEGTPTADVAPDAASAVGFTHLRPSGNRVVAGRTALSEVTARRADVGDRPVWVAGVPAAGDDASLWLVLTEGGGLVGVRVAADDGRRSRVDVRPPRLDDGTVPVARRRPNGELGLLTDVRTAPNSHPVPVAGAVATVTRDGAVSVRSDGDPRSAAVEALPDARPVVAGGRVAVLAGRTTAYGHGVLGDDVEATAVSLVSPDAEEVARLGAPEGTVFEGITPLAADVDGDGTAEFVATASDAQAGGRVVALDESGDHLVGPAVGTGFRWRHTLAVAPFGPGDEREVAVVKTPHVGGVAEFYGARPDRGTLELVATSDGGYRTHTVGSRTLDGAVAGRVLGDDRWCLVVPDRERRRLVVLARTAEGDGVSTATRLDLPGTLTSNLAAVTVDGEVHLAAGTADGLVVWTR
jgi:hypothetical protein